MTQSHEQVEPARTRRPRSPRLTGRQITTIAVAFAVAVVLFPVGVKASGQLVTIMDSATTRKARVDTRNRLTIVDMPVNATPWNFVTGAGSDESGKIFVPPTGKTTLAVGSLTIMNATSAAVEWSGGVYLNASCTSFSHRVPRILIPAGETVHLDFPQPLLISPGGSNWCYKGLTAAVTVTAVGYYY